MDACAVDIGNAFETGTSPRVSGQAGSPPTSRASDQTNQKEAHQASIQAVCMMFRSFGSVMSTAAAVLILRVCSPGTLLLLCCSLPLLVVPCAVALPEKHDHALLACCSLLTRRARETVSRYSARRCRFSLFGCRLEAFDILGRVSIHIFSHTVRQGEGSERETFYIHHHRIRCWFVLKSMVPALVFLFIYGLTPTTSAVFPGEVCCQSTPSPLHSLFETRLTWRLIEYCVFLPAQPPLLV